VVLLLNINLYKNTSKVLTPVDLMLSTTSFFSINRSALFQDKFSPVSCFWAIKKIMIAQIPGAMFAWHLNFVLWRLILVDP
jgi:hypothetical protein